MWSPLVPFVRLGAATLEKVVSDIQTKTQAALQALAAESIVQGVQVDGVVLRSGVSTPVKHGLGRVASGWLVVDQVGPADVSRVVANEFPKSQLVLVASADTTVSLWVY